MPERPNIIFLLPDQLRADFLSCYGAGFIDTPHIDALAGEGVLYERAYSAAPVCVPARVSLLTGMNAIRNGVLDNSHFLAPHYAASGVCTWPELLSQRGYHTAAIGKMHFYPWDAAFGFERRIIAEDKIWTLIDDDYARALRAAGYIKSVGEDKPEYHQNHGAFISDIPWEWQVDRWVGQEACRYIREYRDERPFALMVGFPGPHNPYNPAPEFARLFDPAAMPAPIPAVEGIAPAGRGTGLSNPSWWAPRNDTYTEAHARIQRAHYAALVKQIDHEVGEIMAALAERGLLENTVVILSSDHGDYLGDHGLQGKNSFFESATRVPLIARLPGRVCPRREPGLVELTDVTATMLRLADAPGATEAVPAFMDARPLPGLGLGVAEGREYVVGMLASGWMVCDGEWKLHKYADGRAYLFNLLADPAECHDLYHEPRYADVLRRLDGILTRELMRSVREATYEHRAMAGSLSRDAAFGQPGWVRPYPGPVGR